MLRIWAEAPARIAWASRGNGRDGSVFHPGADAQASALGLLDVAGEAGHIHQHVGMLDRLTHEVDKIGAAAEILGARTRSGSQSRAHVGGALVPKWIHQAASRAGTGAAKSPNVS
jgi:hypothetical protein